MGTRSFIAMKTEGGFKGIYCHWDGYLDWNGRILLEHYSHQEKLARLIALGNISVLGEEIGKKHGFDARPEGETTFYGRDRGDDNQGPVSKRTLNSLQDHAGRCGCEYFYVFDGKQWEYAERGMQFFGLSDGTSFSRFKSLASYFVKDE